MIGLTQDYYEVVDSGFHPTVDGSMAGTASEGGPGDAENLDASVPGGKLVFHRYTSYESGDSKMFIVTFPGGAIGDELGQAYGLCNPLNGIFSPDGDHLAIMAAQRNGNCGPTDRSQFDVYILDLTTPGQKQQVTLNTLPDEDPQFSPAGDFILFKHNGHLAQWALGSLPFTTCATPPDAGSFCFNASAGEQSKPVMTAGSDPPEVCYYESSGASADVYCFDLAVGLRGDDITVNHTTAVAHPGINDSRPTIDMPYLYYVRWRDAGNTTNFIARKRITDLSGEGETAAFCRDTGSDYTDPCPLPGNVLIFSSDVAGFGSHDLFLAGFGSGSMFPLDRLVPSVTAINTALDELGASFWPQR